jgi:FeS assembly SUF system protein
MKSPTKEQIIEAIRTVYDPEIHVNIYDLGLVYDICVDNNDVHVKMTLTSAFCPAAESLPIEVEQAIKEVPKVKNVKLEIVWEPAWTKDMMSDEAKLELGFYD